MGTFQKVYERLGQAFGAVPCEELGISDEVKEQVYVLSVSHIFPSEKFLFSSFLLFFHFLEEWF